MNVGVLLNKHVTPYIQVLGQYGLAADYVSVADTCEWGTALQVDLSFSDDRSAAESSPTSRHEATLVALGVLEYRRLTGLTNARHRHLAALRQRNIAAGLREPMVTEGTAFPRLLNLGKAKTRCIGIGRIWRSIWTPDCPTQGNVVLAEAVTTSVWLPDNVLISCSVDEHHTALKHALAVLARGTTLAWRDHRVGTERLGASDTVAVDGWRLLNSITRPHETAASDGQ